MTLDEQCEQIRGEVGAVVVGSITQACGTLQCRTPSLELGLVYRYVNVTLDFTSCGHKKAMVPLLYLITSIRFAKNDFIKLFK